jgi:phytoene/squalene synthetase
MLHLFRAATPQNVGWSDAICTGLQLVNFWQDVAVDLRKDRIYLPQDDMARHGVAEAELFAASVGDSFRALMAFQVSRARAMLESGAPLARAVAGRSGFELRLVVQGGLRILERIDRVRGDVFRHRPVLKGPDWLLMLWRAAARYPR